jgi:hypothetical protein
MHLRLCCSRIRHKARPPYDPIVSWLSCFLFPHDCYIWSSLTKLDELFFLLYHPFLFSMYVIYVHYLHRLVLVPLGSFSLKKKSSALTFRFLGETNRHLRPCGGGVSHPMCSLMRLPVRRRPIGLFNSPWNASCRKAIRYHALAVLGEAPTSCLPFNPYKPRTFVGCRLFKIEVKIH